MTESDGEAVRWKPIATAPHDGKPVLCCWSKEWWRNHKRVPYMGEDHDPVLLMWRDNSRMPGKEYFGDLKEADDYELSEPHNQPTHWLPIPDLP